MLKKFPRNIRLLAYILLLTGLGLRLFLPTSVTKNNWQMIQYGGGSYSPDIAIAPNGNPCVVWSSDRDIYLRCWNGNNWQELDGSASGGGISNDPGRSIFPSIAIASDGTIYVAWANQETGNDRIYIKRWYDEKWEEFGTKSASGIGISEKSEASSPDLAIAPDDTLYVVWSHTSRGPIYVKHWDGSEWQEVADSSASDIGISDKTGSSGWPSIAIAADGTVYITWVHKVIKNDYSEHSISVQMFKDNSGQLLGDKLTSQKEHPDLNGFAFHSKIAVTSDGIPYVTWSDDNGIQVRRWVQNQWEEVGHNSIINRGFIYRLFGIENIGSPEIAVTLDGTPYLIWDGEVDNRRYYDIYALYWNSKSWEEAGQNSATGGGISDSDTSKPGGHSWSVSIALGIDNYPYVAWEDQRSGFTEIYVKLWNGREWENVGANGTAGKYQKEKRN